MAAARTRERLLYRAISSHLVVAVPPAVVLGFLVHDLNRDALRVEIEQLHLSVAAQLREEIARELDARAAALEHSERILDMTEVPLESRKAMLRALVATSPVDHLVIHAPGGAFDSIVSSDAAADTAREPLSPALRDELGRTGFAVDASASAGTAARVFISWIRGGEVLGYLGTSLDLVPFSRLATDLADRYLGPGGQVDVVDRGGRYLASSVEGRTGRNAGPGTPFSGLRGFDGAGVLPTIEMGVSSAFDDTEGERRLGAVVSDPRLHWIVGVSRPEEAAFASLRRAQKRVILMALIAALTAGLVGLLLARTVTEPIRRLARAVRGSMRAGYTEPVAIEAGAEVGELAEAFNEIIRELSEQRRELRLRTQLRLRLARFLPPRVLHDILAKEMDVRTAGEKQLITVIYADVSGAKALGDRIAPELLVTILGEFFAAACAAVERHRGRVDRYSGDAVIGVFAERRLESGFAPAALEAARDMLRDTEAISLRWRDSVGAAIHASVGAVTGKAVLGRAPDGTGEVAVVGGLVDWAASLQEAAAPGTIMVDRRTREAAGDRFDWRTVESKVASLASKELFMIDPSRTTEELAR